MKLGKIAHARHRTVTAPNTAPLKHEHTHFTTTLDGYKIIQTIYICQLQGYGC